MPNRVITLQISLRDFYAGQALLGLSHVHPAFDREIIAKDAFLIADEMIAVGNATKPSPWGGAPDWANYIATDEDGQAHYFEAKPRRGNFGWRIDSKTKHSEAKSYSFDGGWMDSLLVRGES